MPKIVARKRLTSTIAFLKPRKKASNQPALIHCAQERGASKLKTPIFGIFSKDDSSGNAGAEGDSNYPGANDMGYKIKT
ncbi:hypothetical protein LEP1GSC038_0227 [Leptospira weilii str. 2006001855]|uniref:Uncharacterized protein n=1 Tax=Leptospira weilii str. 2006001855 TaxID=996804 RepID=M6G2D4_9LEPT|nr:hypothetical protein LEP1GSC038_0227 [Leptospira weilii str. 2006001855]